MFCVYSTTFVPHKKQHVYIFISVLCLPFNQIVCLFLACPENKDFSTNCSNSNQSKILFCCCRKQLRVVVIVELPCCPDPPLPGYNLARNRGGAEQQDDRDQSLLVTLGWSVELLEHSSELEQGQSFFWATLPSIFHPCLTVTFNAWLWMWAAGEPTMAECLTDLIALLPWCTLPNCYISAEEGNNKAAEQLRSSTVEWLMEFMLYYLGTWLSSLLAAFSVQWWSKELKS